MNTGTPAQRADLFLRWLQPIRRDLEVYCRRLIWNPQEVQDALHNALMRAVAAFDRCEGSHVFRAWMFKILTHEVLALNRKHARIAHFEFQVEPEEMENLADAFIPGNEVIEFQDWRENLEDALNQALKTLSDVERAVLLLRGIGDFKYQEISAELNLPIGSVMGYLARARNKMRIALRRIKCASRENL